MTEAGGDRLATLTGMVRVLSGLALAAAPGHLGRLLVGEDADRPWTRLLLRAFGARDALLGAGVVLAGRKNRPQLGWVASCAVADAFDAAATVAELRVLPWRRRALPFGVSAGPALLNAALAARLARAEAARSR